MGISLKVLFDENIIARIRAGEHVSFFIEPGFHAVGTSDTTLTVPCAAGQKYSDPVVVDPVTQTVYLPRTIERASYHEGIDTTLILRDMPLLDYPLLLTDRSAVEIDWIRGAESRS